MIYQLSNEYHVRTLSENDINGPWPSWFEDQIICRYNSHGKFFKTKEFFQEYLKQLNQEDRIVWAICHSNEGHVGNVSLQQISMINRTAEFAIIIGEQSHCGKGLGRLVGRQLMQHGFNKINLDRIYLGTAETNFGMIKLATIMGMTLEGTRRQHLYLDGKKVDVVEYGILRSEFERNDLK